MIYVVRHAQSAPEPGLAPADYPLTPQGRESAMKLVPVLSALGIERVYSSPYRRAADTVVPFALSAALGCGLDPELRERKLAGCAFPSPEAHVAAVRSCWEDFDHRFPGGESNRECQARAVGAVSRLCDQHSGERIVLASHGQWTSLLLNAIDPGFGVKEWLAIPNPAIFQVDLEERTWQAVSLVEGG